jgi:hypothetical protein
MIREEENTNAFFEQLQGKPPTDGRSPRPGIAALRDALQAQIATMRSAETATAADLTSEEKEHMDALKQRLINQGLLGVPVTPVVANTKSQIVKQPSLLQRIGEALLGDSWYRPVAFAASMVFGVLVVLKVAFPPSIDIATQVNVERGADTPVIVAPDPAAATKSLDAKLTDAGAKVITTNINAKESSMHIDVPETGNLVAVKKILSDAGIPITEPPPYDVTVKVER